MAPNAADSNADGGLRSGVTLRWFVGVVGRVETYRNLAYLLLAFPLGLAYFILFTVGVSVGLALSIVLVGVLLLAVTLAGGLAVAGLERRLTNALLQTSIAGRSTLSGDGYGAQSKALLLDRRTWTALAYLPVKFGLGLVSFVVVMTGIPTAIAMLSVPLYYDRSGLFVGVASDRAPEIHETIYLGWNYLLVGVETAFTLGYWEIDTLGAAIVVAGFGIVCLLGTLHLCNGLAWLWARYAHWSMDGSYDLLAAIVSEDSSSDGSE